MRGRNWQKTVEDASLLMEQLDYNLLFRWFVGLEMDDPMWDATVFTKNRDRLLAAEVAELFFRSVVERARRGGLMSREHFTVDGTLIEAWAGQKSVAPKRRNRPKGRGKSGRKGSRNPAVTFRGQKRSNRTHASTTDPDARMYRKSKGAETKLGYLGHVLMDNRWGLVVDTRVAVADGTAERDRAPAMIESQVGRGLVTLAGDNNYDTRGFINSFRKRNLTPHVARKQHSAIDGRTTRHEGYRISQRKRKCVEQVFGWMNTVGTMRKTRYKGRDWVGWMFTFAVAAYNLVRIRNLIAAPAWGARPSATAPFPDVITTHNTAKPASTLDRIADSGLEIASSTRNSSSRRVFQQPVSDLLNIYVEALHPVRQHHLNPLRPFGPSSRATYISQIVLRRHRIAPPLRSLNC